MTSAGDERTSLPPWELVARASQMRRVADARTEEELLGVLHDDRTRLRFLERLRWPKGFRCARCGSCRQPSRPRPGVLVCARCHWFATVTADTFLRDARVPLAGWLAMYWAIAAGKLLPTTDGLRSFLRFPDPAPQALAAAAVLTAAESPPLEGDVDFDGRAVEVAGRVELLLVAAEHRADGRVRMRRTATLDKRAVRQFIEDAVAVGSTVHTDCWSNHLGLDELPVVQRVHLGLEPPALGTALPRLDEISSWLRRWLSHHRVVRRDDVGVALDGFCLAYNRARHRPVGSVFCHLMRAVFVLAHAQRHKRRKISGILRVSDDVQAAEDGRASA